MKLKYEFQTVELDDNTMAVPVGADDDFKAVIRLNETAAFIFDLLKEDTTIDEIVEKAAKEYDSDAETIKKYVVGFVNNLIEKGVIEK